MTIMANSCGMINGDHDPNIPIGGHDQPQLMYSNYPMPGHDPQQQQLILDSPSCQLEPNPLYLSLGSTGSSVNSHHSLPRSHSGHQVVNSTTGFTSQHNNNNQDHHHRMSGHCRSLNSHQNNQPLHLISSSSIIGHHPSNGSGGHRGGSSDMIQIQNHPHHYHDQHPQSMKLQSTEHQESYAISMNAMIHQSTTDHNLQQSRMVNGHHTRVLGPPTGNSIINNTTTGGLIQCQPMDGLIQGSVCKKKLQQQPVVTAALPPPPSLPSSALSSVHRSSGTGQQHQHQQQQDHSTVMMLNDGSGGSSGRGDSSSQINNIIPSGSGACVTGLSTNVMHSHGHQHQQHLLTTHQQQQHVQNDHHHSSGVHHPIQMNHGHHSSVNPFLLQSNGHFDLRQQFQQHQQHLIQQQQQQQSRASPSSGSNQSGCDHHSSVSKSSSTALSSQALFLHNQVMNQQLIRQSQLTQSQIHSQQFLKSQLIHQQQQQQQQQHFSPVDGGNKYPIQSTTTTGLTPDQVNYANGQFNNPVSQQRVQGRGTLLNGGNRIQQQVILNGTAPANSFGHDGYASFNGPPIVADNQRVVNGSSQRIGADGIIGQSMVNGDIYSQVNYGNKYNSRLNGHSDHQLNGQHNGHVNQPQVNGLPAKEFKCSETKDGQQILACLDTSSSTSSIRFRTKKKKKPTPFKPPPKPILATLHDLLLTSVTSGTNGHTQQEQVDGTHQSCNNNQESLNQVMSQNSLVHQSHQQQQQQQNLLLGTSHQQQLLNGQFNGYQYNCNNNDAGRGTGLDPPSFTAITVQSNSHHPHLVPSMSGHQSLLTTTKFEPVPPKVPTSNRPPVPIHRPSNGMNKSQISPASTTSKHSISSLTKITGCLRSPLSVGNLLNGHSPKSQSVINGHTVMNGLNVNSENSPKSIESTNNQMKVKTNPVIADQSQQSLVRPKCTNCSNVIIDEECTEAEGGVYHIKCFVCYNCSSPLGGCQYIMARDTSENEKDQVISYDNEWSNGDCIKRGAKLRPFCTPCYDSLFGEFCEGCGELIQVAKGTAISHDGRSWHATPDCFNCYNCSSSLLGLPFLPHSSGLIFCSVNCSKEAFKVKSVIGRKVIKEEADYVNDEQLMDREEKIEEVKEIVSSVSKKDVKLNQPPPSSQSPTISSTCESTSHSSSPSSTCSNPSPDCDPHLINPAANSLNCNPVTLVAGSDSKIINPVSESRQELKSDPQDNDTLPSKSRIPVLVQPGHQGMSHNDSNQNINCNPTTTSSCQQQQRGYTMPLSCNRSLSEVLEEDEEQDLSDSSSESESDVTSSSDSSSAEEVAKEEKEFTAKETAEEKVEKEKVSAKDIAKETSAEDGEEEKKIIITSAIEKRDAETTNLVADCDMKRDKYSSSVQVLRKRFEGQDNEDDVTISLTPDRDYDGRQIKIEARRVKGRKEGRKDNGGINTITEPCTSSSLSSNYPADVQDATLGHDTNAIGQGTSRCGENGHGTNQHNRTSGQSPLGHRDDMKDDVPVRSNYGNYASKQQQQEEQLSDIMNLATNEDNSLTSSDNNTKVSPLPPNEVNVSIKSPKNVTFNKMISVMETSALSTDDLDIGHYKKPRRKVERKDSGRKKSGRKGRKCKDESEDEEDILTDSSESSTTVTDTNSESSDTEAEEDEEAAYATYRPTYRPAVKRQQEACVVQ